MNISENQEIWQVDAGGEIHQARFEDLPEWIYQGSLLPQDLVKRGNLRWIEAQKVPALLRIFNARESGVPLADVALNSGNSVKVQITPAPAETKFCVMHAHNRAVYACDVCANHYCENCLNRATNCLMCGAECRKIAGFEPQNNYTPAPQFVNPAFGAAEQIRPSFPSQPPPANIAEPVQAFPSDVARSEGKKGVGLIWILLLSGAISAFAAYGYAYHYVTPDEQKEKDLPEIVALTEKFQNDKAEEEKKIAAEEAKQRRAKQLEEANKIQASSPAPSSRAGGGSGGCTNGMGQPMPCNEQLMKIAREMNKGFDYKAPDPQKIQEDLKKQISVGVFPSQLNNLEANYNKERTRIVDEYRQNQTSRNLKLAFFISFFSLTLGMVGVRSLIGKK